jgi:Arc/MetJ-type ribon-helix-helix transcriptional regulator
MTISIQLSEHASAQVEAHMTSHNFASAEAVIVEALARWERNEQQLMSSLRADIQVGLNDIDAGRIGIVDFLEIKRLGRERLSLA